MKNYFVCYIFLFLKYFGIAQTFPVLEWAGDFGGNTSITRGYSITVDSIGNTYTTGTFNDPTDFNPGISSYNLSPSGGSLDIFISKLDPSGNFVWAKKIGNTSDEIAKSITLDVFGNIYITGNFMGTVDFNPGSGTFFLTSGGPPTSNEVFILKLTTSGNFVWAKSLGGSYDEFGLSVTTDIAGSVYASGISFGTGDYNPGADTCTLPFTGTGVNDSFICKLDSAGNFVWAKKIGGTSTTYANSIFTDENQNVYVAGYFDGVTDFDPSSSTYNLNASFNAMFILKLDQNGNYIWVKQMGGSASVEGLAINVDVFGNIYGTGFFSSSPDFDPDSTVFNLNSTGSKDIFVAKLNNSGDFLWAKNFGGELYDAAHAITSDGLGNIYVTGTFSDTVNFNSMIASNYLFSNGGDDIFVLKLDPAGNFIWAENIGGISSDGGESIVLDQFFNVYTTGFFRGTADFDSSSAAFNLSTTSGFRDAFVQKVNQTSVEIQEKLLLNKISTYPNPTTGLFNLAISKNSIIEIYNSVGTLIKTQIATGGKNTVDISNVAKGLYYIKIMSDGNLLGTSKIINQ
jgi:hypothetical protein